MKIEESNKLIAEFMDIHPSQNVGIRERHYDKDWNQLMPVVEKIMSIKNINFDMTIKFGVEDDYCTLRTREKFNKASNWNWDLLVCEQNKGKETVYKTVVEFIKWYNKNK